MIVTQFTIPEKLKNSDSQRVIWTAFPILSMFYNTRVLMTSADKLLRTGDQKIDFPIFIFWNGSRKSCIRNLWNLR